MNEPNLNPIPPAILKARVEADRLARLLNEELPNGDELKDVWYEVNRTIRPALAAIRELEGQATSQRQQTDCAGVG
jgi:hypothetical protein